MEVVVLPVGHGPKGGVLQPSDELRKKLQRAGVGILEPSESVPPDAIQLTIGDLAYLEAGGSIRSCLNWRRGQGRGTKFDPNGCLLTESEVADVRQFGPPWDLFLSGDK